MTPLPTADPDDRALLAAHLDGDADAFGTLFARHRDRLWAVALRTTGDPEEAADALQDAMVAAFRRAGSYRGDAAVTTWLHRVVVNACLDRLRRRKVRLADPLPDDLDDRADRGSLATSDTMSGHGTEDPADRAVAGERRSAVLAALDTLPAEQRAALVLVDMEGYSVEETAAILECAPGTVKSRCSRGRARLLPLLADLAARRSAGEPLARVARPIHAPRSGCRQTPGGRSSPAGASPGASQAAFPDGTRVGPRAEPVHPTDPHTRRRRGGEQPVTPEQEEQVRRALGSLPPEGPVPPEVARRLDARLAELVAERDAESVESAEPTGSPAAPVGDGAERDDLAARRRRRRWRTGLVAAASVAVLGVGLGTVVDDLSLGGGDSASTTAGAGDSAPETASEDAAGEADRLTDGTQYLAREPAGPLLGHARQRRGPGRRPRAGAHRRARAVGRGGPGHHRAEHRARARGDHRLRRTPHPARRPGGAGAARRRARDAGAAR